MVFSINSIRTEEIQKATDNVRNHILCRDDCDNGNSNDCEHYWRNLNIFRCKFNVVI